MTEQERIQSIIHNGGEHLKNFKKENITYDMSLAAVQSTGDAIRFVPEQFCTKEIYLEACKHGGMNLNRVPERFMSKQMCEFAIESTGLALQYVPKKYQTKELCRKAAIRSAQAYWFIPFDFITPEFVTDVAQHSSYESISSLPESIKKGPFYYELICLDPKFIWYIPRKALTAKIGKAAIKSMGYASTAEAVKSEPELLSRLHTSLYDHEACLCFVTSEFFKKSLGKDIHGNTMWGFNTRDDERAGRFYLAQKYNDTYSLPDMMKWEDVATPFLALNGYYITYVPTEIITEEMCRVAIKSNPNSFKYIPEKYKTKEMCKYAFNKEPFLIEYFPEEYISEKLALRAVKHSGFILNYLPEKYRSKEVCLIAVSDEGHGKIDDVPISVIDKDICLAWLKNSRFEFDPLDKIPKEFWDYEVLYAAVSLDGNELEKVPFNLRDEAMCLAAVKRDNHAAKYVPKA